MTHKDSSRYADKHPRGTEVTESLRQAVRDQLTDQTIACAAAHRIAQKQKVAASDIGIAIDLQEARIRECQLGLFGHGPRKTIIAAEKVSAHLKAAIEAVLADGRLPCAQAWRIADGAGMPRMAVAQACEHLKIRISKCQLGAF